jgi:hypothetical protein
MTGYEMTRYCIVCEGYQNAHVFVGDGECIEITCTECYTQSIVPRFA